jgi:hypothetical protein
VSARKNQNVPLYCTHAVNHAISPRSNLVWRFATGATIAEQFLARALGMDLRSAQTLVFAVVSFEQVAIDFGLGAEASQLAGPGCASQRTRKHSRKMPCPELFAELTSVALAAVRERQVGKSGVLARETPRSLTVPC